MSSPHVIVSLMGEGGLLFEFTPVLNIPVQKRIWHLNAMLATHPQIKERVPGVGNLLVLFDPLSADVERLESDVRTAWTQANDQAGVGVIHDVPVTYGGEFGEDLAHVAAVTGLSVTDVVKRHEASELLVAAVGAMPGFPYLLGLDAGLFIPRRGVPRVKVEQGSVVIAGGMAGVITRTSASGWHILGRSSLDFFDLNQQPAALLAPGDRIRFHAEKVVA